MYRTHTAIWRGIGARPFALRLYATGEFLLLSSIVERTLGPRRCGFSPVRKYMLKLLHSSRVTGLAPATTLAFSSHAVPATADPRFARWHSTDDSSWKTRSHTDSRPHSKPPETRRNVVGGVAALIGWEAHRGSSGGAGKLETLAGKSSGGGARFTAVSERLIQPSGQLYRHLRRCRFLAGAGY